MFKYALVYASFVASMAAGSVNAQQLPATDSSVIQASQQKVEIPGTGYEFVLGSFKFPADGYVGKSPLDRNDTASRLVTALVTWISDNFDIPANYNHPRTAPMSSFGMTNLVYQRIPTDQQQAMSIDQMRKVISLYSVEKKTIYMQPEWTGRTPAELSMLVHEMVHHLQTLNHSSFPCPAAEEKLPYEAQEKWLNMFGRSLSSEFGLDRTTIVLTTACME